MIARMADPKLVGVKSLLLRAWRERWPDVQWSINVKKLLPPGGNSDNFQLAGTCYFSTINSILQDIRIHSYCQGPRVQRKLLVLFFEVLFIILLVK